MKTATLLSPHDLAEPDVARIPEERFGAAWFPEYHRYSIETDEAFVAVDVDHEFAGRLASEEQQTLVRRLGFTPRTALHVQASVYHPGSPGLAERVFQTLCSLFDGRPLPAA